MRKGEQCRIYWYEGELTINRLWVNLNNNRERCVGAGITTDRGIQTHIHISDLIKSTIYNKVRFGFINVNVFRKLRL